MLGEISLGTLKRIITPYQKVRVKYNSHGKVRILWEGEICGLPREYNFKKLDFIETGKNNEDVLTVYLVDGEV